MGPMGIMFFVILFSVLYANAEGANGIVKGKMENGKDWPKEGVTHYTHLLECDHRHNFPNDQLRPFTYDIHCMKITESGKLILSINYDNNVFENFEVTTCDREAVIKSVFPPEQKSTYTSDDEPDTLGIPTVSYLKYITVDGECFARRYKYKNRRSRAAERFEPKKFNCEIDSEWSNHGKVAEFANCRVAPEKLSNIVIDVIQGKPAWMPAAKDEDEEKHQRLLECTFDQFSQLYSLTCVKGDKENEYFAFVKYGKHLLDRFTVVSCKEEDIVNGILPMKETSKNPKNPVHGKPWIETIFFSKQDGNCYKRKYPGYNYFGYSGPTQEIKEETCPDPPELWTNPTWGKVGMWRECTVPKTKQESDATKAGESGAPAGDKQE